MESFNLDYPLLRFSKADLWEWTVRHAVEGVQIFGGIGSGKTSGSGRTLALKFLQSQFGGLVLTVKPDEKDEWVKYCKLAGREDDLIIIEPGGKHSFNFLEFESTNADGEEAITENIVDVLKTVIRAGEAADKGKSDDAFWETALDMLMFNIVDLCKMANGKVSVEDMYNIVQTLPKAANDKKPSDPNAPKKSDKERAFNVAFEKVRQNVMNLVDKIEKDIQKQTSNNDYCLTEEQVNEIPQVRLFYFLDQFFGDSFKNLSEKTRSIIEFTFSGFLFRLLREPIYSMFCNKPSNVTPFDSANGKIILINLPVKKFHKVGRDCQILFKYIWQRTMEQRHVEANSRPVFLWADEAQNFIHEHDADFQATARSSKVATVYLTQNIPNYYGSMGGSSGEHKVKSFIGTLGTKIFHANSDHDTNLYASSIIGKAYYKKKQQGTTSGADKDKTSFNTTESEELQEIFQPNEFVGLKNGGKANNLIVSAIVQIQGTPIFQNNENYSLVKFKQSD